MCKTSACCTPGRTSVGGSALQIPALMHSGRLVSGLVELLERARGAKPRSSAPRGGSLVGSWNYSSGLAVRIPCPAHPGEVAQLLREEKM